MFSTQTENTLATNMPLESGLPGMAVMPAEVYRELVYAARQWDAIRAGANHPTSAAQLPANLGETYQFTAKGGVERKPTCGQRLTYHDGGKGDTFAVG